MKHYFSKITLCLMFAGMFLAVSSQTTQTAPANSGKVQLNEKQLKRANDIADRVASEVTLTPDQNTKLHTSMQEAIAGYTTAVLKAKKENDDSKLSTVNADLVADVTARIKAILTPEQYTTVMAKEKANQ